MPVLVSCKYEKDRMLWKPVFWSNLPQNLKQPFPHPSDATQNLIKIGQLASEIFKFESKDDNDGPLVYYKLILWAFGSGELKTWIKMALFLN